MLTWKFRIAWESFTEGLSPVWVRQTGAICWGLPSDIADNAFQVDLGGSLAVASRGLYATGVSTDLSGKKDVFAAGCVFTSLLLKRRTSDVFKFWWKSRKQDPRRKCLFVEPPNIGALNPEKC